MSDLIATWTVVVWLLFIGIAMLEENRDELGFGQITAFAFFWPITVPVYLLINLWRLARRVKL